MIQSANLSRGRAVRSWWILSLVATLPLACSGEIGDGSTRPRSQEAAEIHERLGDDVAVDLPAMHERGTIRVLVVPSRTNYFVVGGLQQGFEYELLSAWEKELGAGGDPEGTPTRVVFVPVPLGEILDALEDGRGDVAAAGLTITEDRERRVAFADPYLPAVDEILVTGPGETGPDTVEDLGGRTVYVVAGSSYAETLGDLNERLVAGGRDPVEVAEVPELASEDLLELVNAGALPSTVVDGHVARLWSSVLPDLVLREDLVLRQRGRIAWAVRKDSPLLRASLSEFARTHRKGSLLGNILFRRYFADQERVRNPVDELERAKLEPMRESFVRYGEEYGFDWLLLAAQGFQESGLDQSRRSQAGAVGVMQLLPSTAADPNVGIPAISTVDANIHAGAKYLAFLRDRYFSGATLSDRDRIRLSLAAYNAGPARVAQLRAEATRRGLDPDRWFDHVERVALDRVGWEPVRYVANIEKYHLAYRLMLETGRAREDERARLEGDT